MNKVGLYLMAVLYVAAGVLHLVFPDFYLGVMPLWLPWQLTLITLSGIAEMVLGLLLLIPKTRVTSAWLIITMLVVYLFVIHVPMVIDFAASGNALTWLAMVRIPIQFLLIWWAWRFTRLSHG